MGDDGQHCNRGGRSRGRSHQSGPPPRGNPFSSLTHTHPYSVGRVRPAAGEAASRALDVRGDGVLGGAEETQGRRPRARGEAVVVRRVARVGERGIAVAAVAPAAYASGVLPRGPDTRAVGGAAARARAPPLLLAPLLLAPSPSSLCGAPCAAHVRGGSAVVRRSGGGRGRILRTPRRRFVAAPGVEERERPGCRGRGPEPTGGRRCGNRGRGCGSEQPAEAERASVGVPRPRAWRPRARRMRRSARRRRLGRKSGAMGSPGGGRPARAGSRAGSPPSPPGRRPRPPPAERVERVAPPRRPPRRRRRPRRRKPPAPRAAGCCRFGAAWRAASCAGSSRGPA